MGQASLRHLRRTASRYQVDEAVLSRLTVSADGSGGQTASSTQTLGTYPCRITRRIKQSAEEATAGRPALTEEWVVRLPYGTSVDVRDRITVGALTLEVVDPGNTQTWEVERILLCRKVS